MRLLHLFASYLRFKPRSVCAIWGDAETGEIYTEFTRKGTAGRNMTRADSALSFSSSKRATKCICHRIYKTKYVRLICLNLFSQFEGWVFLGSFWLGLFAATAAEIGVQRCQNLKHLWSTEMHFSDRVGMQKWWGKCKGCIHVFLIYLKTMAGPI